MPSLLTYSLAVIVPLGVPPDNLRLRVSSCSAPFPPFSSVPPLVIPRLSKNDVIVSDALHTTFLLDPGELSVPGVSPLPRIPRLPAYARSQFP